MELLVRQRGTWWLLGGLALQYGAIAAHSRLPQLAFQVLGFAAGAMLVYGGTRIAQWKGYTPWVGFAALFSFLGVGFLLMMPDPTLTPALRWLARKPEPAPQPRAADDADDAGAGPSPGSEEPGEEAGPHA